MATKTVETDYLVVGCGAAGMAFTDALIEASDAQVVMVDRRHAPGGHWNDAYPFVRLHQPSAYDGVNSLPLGQRDDRPAWTEPGDVRAGERSRDLSGLRPGHAAAPASFRAGSLPSESAGRSNARRSRSDSSAPSRAALSSLSTFPDALRRATGTASPHMRSVRRERLR
jgi:hypothetical protein